MRSPFVVKELSIILRPRLRRLGPEVCQCATMVASMSWRPSRGVLILASLAAGLAWSQTSDEEFRIYNEHPRLFLTNQRLRLLKRERERDSPRWQQFDAIVKGAATLPEPGFSAALYFAISGDSGQGKRAVDWALGPGADLRQLALVYDWCQPILSAQQSQTLKAKIVAMIAKIPDSEGLVPQRDRVLAVIATADENQHGEERSLRQVVEQWWRKGLALKLIEGNAMPLHESNALLETLHAIRDNLKIELEEDAQPYFRDLPKYQILGNYPAPLAGPENEYWIPVYKESGEPDLNRAALARAADLSLVAYDNNGAPYEFLWANPYQPGLAYTQLAPYFYSKNSGVLFARATWADDALWFGLYNGEAQLFQDGRITVLSNDGRAASHAKPIHVGAVSVVQGANPVDFAFDANTTLVVGLKSLHKYTVEIDDQEMREMETDRAGTLELQIPAGRMDGVRIREPLEHGG